MRCGGGLASLPHNENRNASDERKREKERERLGCHRKEEYFVRRICDLALFTGSIQ